MKYYYPPRDWPPKTCNEPPADNWTPPEFWEPSPNRPPLSPLGELLIRPALPEASSSSSSDQLEDETHRVVRRMLGMWARTVQADTHSYWQSAMRAAWIDRAIDFGEEWSPSKQDLPPALEQVWIRGYKLITSAYQMERWLQAHRRLSGEPEEPMEYRHLRNALEHLDEAQFTTLTATKQSSDNKKRSIDELPGGQIFLGFEPNSTETAFGVVHLAEVFERARKYRYVDSDDVERQLHP